MRAEQSRDIAHLTALIERADREASALDASGARLEAGAVRWSVMIERQRLALLQLAARLG